MEENFSNDYYDNKLIKNLSFMKFELKYLILIIWGGVGYQCYITNHFLAFSIISALIVVYVFIFKFFKGVHKMNEVFKECFNKKDSDIQK